MFLGPAPNVDIVLSICLQSDIPVGKAGKSGTAQNPMLSGPATSDLSGSSRSRPVPSGSSFKTRDRHSGKRKDRDSTFMFFNSRFDETMLIAISFILVTYCMCLPVTVSHALKDILLALQKFSHIEANEILQHYIWIAIWLWPLIQVLLDIYQS